jgi:beta-galactosidase
LGIRKKDSLNELSNYRLIWDSIKYEPGELKVVAFGSNGVPMATEILRASGKPVKIQLSSDVARLRSTGKDLSYITVKVLDKDGNMCATANNDIQFEVKGVGLLKGVCNGDATSLNPFTANHINLYNGQCVVTIQSSRSKGTITINAKGTEFQGTYISLISK